jgi:hypothetical protein
MRVRARERPFGSHLAKTQESRRSLPKPALLFDRYQTESGRDADIVSGPPLTQSDTLRITVDYNRDLGGAEWDSVVAFCRTDHHHRMSAMGQKETFWSSVAMSLYSMGCPSEPSCRYTSVCLVDPCNVQTTRFLILEPPRSKGMTRRRFQHQHPQVSQETACDRSA